MNYYNGTYQASLLDSMQNLWFKVVGYLPNILAAIIFLILGWMVAIFLGKIVQKVLQAVKVDALANRLGLDHLSHRTGRNLSIANFGEWLVKWFFLIGSFIAAADILGLSQVSQFLYTTVFPYFGNVIVACAILLIGMIAANFLAALVKGVVAAGQLRGADALGAVTRWAILILAFLTALDQLKVNTQFIQSLFTAVVAMLALAGGLAFGLGGRDHAKKVLDSLERDLTSDN